MTARHRSQPFYHIDLMKPLVVLKRCEHVTPFEYYSDMDITVEL
jgi:hypothetical protein